MGPIYDEAIEAPSRFKVDIARGLKEVNNLHVQVINTSSNTIGAVPKQNVPPSVMGLFQESSELKIDEDDDGSVVATITAPILM